jgi:hypothetical protein
MMEDALSRADLLPTIENPAVEIEQFIQSLKVRMDQYAELDQSALGLTEFYANQPAKIMITQASLAQSRANSHRRGCKRAQPARPPEIRIQHAREEPIMGITKHDRIAKKIAAVKGTVYHSDKGVDVRTTRQAIEIEVDPATFGEGTRQLQGHRQARYLAVPNNLVKEALERIAGTRVGVMNEKGKIKRRAT